jgi:fimbrial chaperone protein
MLACLFQKQPNPSRRNWILKTRRRNRPTLSLAATLAFFAIPHGAGAQGIMISPVNVVMAPGQAAATLTIANGGDHEISFQIRAFAWQQGHAGDWQLARTNELLVSPPLGTIAPGATQIARMVLSRTPQDRELSYRILIDEIPPPARAGVVRVVLRLSIPVFAEPAGIAAPHVQWRIAREGTRAWLVAFNDGTRHQSVREITLHAADGRTLPLKADTPPYVLAGGEHRWSIQPDGRLPASGTVLRLTALGDGGAIDQQVRVDGGP